MTRETIIQPEVVNKPTVIVKGKNIHIQNLNKEKLDRVIILINEKGHLKNLQNQNGGYSSNTEYIFDLGKGIDQYKYQLQKGGADINTNFKDEKPFLRKAPSKLTFYKNVQPNPILHNYADSNIAENLKLKNTYSQSAENLITQFEKISKAKDTIQGILDGLKIEYNGKDVTEKETISTGFKSEE